MSDAAMTNGESPVESENMDVETDSTMITEQLSIIFSYLISATVQYFVRGKL